MRFIIFGAGAIGGAIGAKLFDHGHDVVLIARGEHRRAVERHGLVLASPDGETTLRIPVVGDPREIEFTDDDVVVLAVKGQDTLAALDSLCASAPMSVPLFCAQNGVENERAALRRFPNVHGMCVMCPAEHLVPGRVEVSSAPVTGLLDVGRWTSGHDEVDVAVAACLSSSTFASVARDDIARWKWGKLLMNLGNAVDALFVPDDNARTLASRARAEGRACLAAAGIDFVGNEEDAGRRGTLLTVRPVGDRRRGGGSTWQSLKRGAGSVETDYLTGEIVLLGRLVGFPTPVNDLLQRLASDAARSGQVPASAPAAEVLAMLGIAGGRTDAGDARGDR